MTTTYTCQKFRPVRQGDPMPVGAGGDYVESASDAARIFAHRYARKKHGKRGGVHHVRLDCAAADGRYAIYEAFIGVPSDGGGMYGRNEQFVVYADPQANGGELAPWR